MMILCKYNRLVLFLLTLIPIIVQNANGQADDLKWKLKTGDQFLATLTQTSGTKTQVDSRKTTVNSSTTIILDWTVTAVDANGDATVEQSLASIKLSVADPAVPDQAVDLDTASKEKPSKVSKKLLDQFSQLIGLKFDVVMSPLGEIKEVTVTDETRGLLNRFPETFKLRELFSEQGLKETLAAAAIVLPDEKLNENASWSTDSRMVTAFGEFNRNRTYTLVGKKTINGRQMAEFSVETALEPVPDENATLVSGSSLNGTVVDVSGSGQLMLDIEGGYFASGKIRNVARSEKPYREKTIKTVVTNQIEMTVQRK